MSKFLTVSVFYTLCIPYIYQLRLFSVIKNPGQGLFQCYLAVTCFHVRSSLEFMLPAHVVTLSKVCLSL